MTSDTTATRPFRLIGQFEDHLKFNGRAPRTLEEKLTAKADWEHRRRLAEIKAMSKKLAALFELVPALAAAGHNLADRDISTYDGGKTLRIPARVLTRDDDLYKAMLALGFREIDRKDWGGRDDKVTLKYGRSLVVWIDVSRAPAASPMNPEPVGEPIRPQLVQIDSNAMEMVDAMAEMQTAGSKPAEACSVSTSCEIEVTIAFADVPSRAGDVLPKDELMKKVDDKHYFWDDKRSALIWRGPASSLPGQKSSPPATQS